MFGRLSCGLGGDEGGWGVLCDLGEGELKGGSGV